MEQTGRCMYSGPGIRQAGKWGTPWRGIDWQRLELMGWVVAVGGGAGRGGLGFFVFGRDVDDFGFSGFFDDGGDGGLIELDFDVVGNFESQGFFLEAGDDAVEAAGGHDMVTSFEGGDLGGEFLLFFSLWADGDEIKQHEH